jgi:hypothetical protein
MGWYPTDTSNMEPMVPHLLGSILLPGIPVDTSISLLPLGMVYRMGFTQYLAASSGLVTTTQGWYPYLAPVLAPPRQVSLYTILVSAATGLQDHSTPLLRSPY